VKTRPAKQLGKLRKTQNKREQIFCLPPPPSAIMPFFTTHWKLSTLQRRIMLVRRIFLQQFETSSLGEYHCLNVKSDILLLANVFEYFIEICLNYYKLYPALKLSY